MSNRNPLLILETCPSCGKGRSPRDILRFGDGGCVRMCLQCYEHHIKALDMLNTGNPPAACQECNTPAESLRNADGNFRMYLHQKDGVYQVLCEWCSDAYERKRRDLYGSTPYGVQKNL